MNPTTLSGLLIAAENYLAAAKKIPVADTITFNTSAAVDHAILTVWNRSVEEGRSMLFAAKSKDDAQLWICRALLNLNIFPRATTLNERLLAFAACRKAAEVTLRIDVATHGPSLQWVPDASRLILHTSLWATLGINEELKLAYQEKLDQLLRQPVTSIEQQAVEAARPLRSLYSGLLRFRRATALDLILQDEAATEALLLATKATTPLDVICDYRSRRFPGLSQETLGKEKACIAEFSLGLDFDLVDLFLCYLQALAFYHPQAKGFRCAAWLDLQEMAATRAEGAALVLVSNRADEVPTLQPNALKTCYLAVAKKVQGVLRDRNDKLQRVGIREDPFTIALRKANTDAQKVRPLRTFYRDVFRADLEDGRSRRSTPNGESAPNLRTPVLQLKAVLNASARLSTAIHEGRRLSFAFALSGGLIWREIEETISDERTQDIPSLPPDAFAGFVHDHWSIFQAERVVGFIDTEDVTDPNLIRLSKIVRLKSPPAWGQVPGHLFSTVSTAVQNCYIIHSRGDGCVLLYAPGLVEKNQASKPRPPLLWNTRTGEVDVLLSPANAAQRILRVLGAKPDDRLQGYLVGVLSNAIQQVSDAPGEGAALVVLPDPNGTKHAKQTSSEGARIAVMMDRTLLQMAWRKPKDIRSLDTTLLRAMLILDGATLIEGNQIAPRFVLYPSCPDCGRGSGHAFCLLDVVNDDGNGRCSFLNEVAAALKKKWSVQTLQDDKAKKIVGTALSGKGSKTHGAAHSTILLWQASGCQTDNFCVVTVSADGPVTLWCEKLSLV